MLADYAHKVAASQQIVMSRKRLGGERDRAATFQACYDGFLLYR
jgi:hypothetical protein